MVPPQYPVTQIFSWRATHQLGYRQIAVRLNADPVRYPRSDPVLGEGLRRVGVWTGGSVRDVLDNPKHTGYMVWNRRRRGHPSRDIPGRANPPSAWVWSSHPTHEPLVTRKLFEAASTVGRFRKQPIQQPRSRQYVYSSILVCDLCGRRAQGEVHKGLVYYRCSPNPRHHGHLSWFDRHPKTALIREEQLTGPLAALFADLAFDQESSRLLLDDPIAAGEITEADLRTLPGPLLHNLCTAFSIQMRFHPLTQAITITASLAAPLGRLNSRRTAE